MLTGRDNSARRAHVQAIGTRRLFSARMRTKAGLHTDIKRLFECADQLACGKDSIRHSTLAFGVGPQVSITFLWGGKQGDTAREIKNDIAVRQSTIPRRGQSQVCRARPRHFAEIH